MSQEFNPKKQAQIAQIKELLAISQVEIVAHFYQRAEVKAVASFVGGGYEVVRRVCESQTPGVMLCGASFMADEVKRLAPNRLLLIPRGDLSCPLADMVGAEEVRAAKRKYPDALVVADMKVPLELRSLADITVSPSTIHKDLAGNKRELIMLPGPQLADWAGFGGMVVNRWERATCQVHELALREDIIGAKALYPQAKVLVNLLCRPDVQALADFVGDSSALRNYCLQSSDPTFIVVSEAGLAEYLAEIMPHQQFHETEAEIFCPNMKLTTLKTIIVCLEKHLADIQNNSQG